MQSPATAENNPPQRYMLGADWLQSNFPEKDLGSRWSASWTWVMTMCHCSQAGQRLPGMREKEQVKRGDPSLLTWRWWDTAGALRPVLGSTVPVTPAHWSESSEGPLGWLWGDIPGKGETSGTVWPGEEEAQGGLSSVYKYLTGGEEKKMGTVLVNLLRLIPVWEGGLD